jgi:outer membrane receptor protein involved in Fe transport
VEDALMKFLTSRALRRAALLAGTAALLSAAAPAMAEDTTPAADAPAQAASTVDGATKDGEIVVTAQKSKERLKDVPASVSVVTASELTSQGNTRFADYAQKVPGLTLTSGRTGISQVTLRGITTGAAQPGSTTGYYVDEAPIGSVNAYTGGSAITPDLDPSDLSQIEVLKGPQGTVYGAGAVGGLLKFTTTTPNLSSFEGSARAGLNDTDHGDAGVSLRGMVNLPIATDSVALRVSGFYRRDGGYIDNVNPVIGGLNVNSASVRGGRAALSAKLGSAVTLDVSALAQDITSRGTNTIDVDAKTLLPIYGNYKQNRFVKEQGRMRLRVYNATLRADLGDVKLVSSTTYQRIFFGEIGDATRSYGAFLTANAPVLGLFAGITIPANLGVRVNTIKHTERWSEEARASIDNVGGFLDLQGGVYWTRESDQNRIPGIDYFSTATQAPITTVPAFAIAKIDSTYEEYSVFGTARVHLGDKFDVLGGLRYSHDNQFYDQDYRGLLISISTGAIATGATTATLAATGKEKANITTWMVNPRFKVSDNLMVYGRAANGYRPGGPNPAPPTGGIPATFDPDKLTQYEVGFKASSGDNAFTADAALFYTDWNHVQIQTSGGGFNYLVNGGTARSQGGELSLRYKPVSGLSFGANAGYTDARLTANAPAAGGLKNDALPYVPHWTGSLTADYSASLGGDLKANFGASANYVGSRVSDYANKFPKTLPAYATFDLRAGIDGGKWSLSGFAKNIGDKRAFVVVGQEGLAASATAGQFYSASLIQPRTIGAEFALKF